MGNIAFPSLDLHLVDLTAAYERQKAPAGYVCIPPVGDAQLNIVLRLQAQGMSSPRQESLSLADDPVLSAIDVD